MSEERTDRELLNLASHWQAQADSFRADRDELLDLITERYKETGEVRLGNVLEKFGRESDWCKLKGIDPAEFADPL